MPNNDVPRCQVLTQHMGAVQQSLIVGNKDLDVVAKLGQLSRRTDKIWNETRCPVPNENLKPFPAQSRSYLATDDPEANHSDRLVL